MLDSLKSKARSRAIADLKVLTVAFILSFLVFASFDVLEYMVEFAHQHEQFEIDELIGASFIIAILFGIFSYRRWQDVKKLSLYCEELSMIDPITLLPNRRVINRLFEDIENEKQQDVFPLSLALVDISGLETLQAQYGNTVAEQALLELFYRYSMLLEKDQLISYRNTNQCLLYCPKTDELQAERLCEDVLDIELESHKSTLSLLSVKAVSVTLNNADQLDDVFEKLEDLLCLARFESDLLQYRKMEQQQALETAES
ncbi:GGDEF domain-containing protein [Neptunicella marina]|uniref:GGDEF domain-containing protein n=1 Tax=Neptunicella marina TaxID=2125989 RepID=A0A8J6LZJ6_9ALTE|nr:GGDEF domain-containing protein [Neptunicella marina]MBC3766190.1 GGDEF domain-containing protein [Neptunicella marina]